MEHIGDLFGRVRSLTPNGKVLSERAELIRYFSEQIERHPQYVGVRLGHYTLSQLYALQSGFKDRLNRDSRETARKWFWWITKTTKEHENSNNH